MELSVHVNGDVTSIAVSGAIDERGAEKLKSAFGSLQLEGQKSVCFDFAGVTHIGSAGLGKLLLVYQKLASAGVAMRVENTSPTLHELLTELRLDNLFHVS